MKKIKNLIMNSKFSLKCKIILIVFIFSALSVTTVMAFPRVILLMNVITTRNLQVLDESKGLVNEIDESNVTCTDKGITVTISDIIIEDNYIMVKSVIKSDSPLRNFLINDKYSTFNSYNESEIDFMKNKLFMLNPMYEFRINDGDIWSFGKSEYKEYLKDENTFESIMKFSILEPLPDKFKMEILSDMICATSGEWSFIINIERPTSNKSITVFPKIETNVKTISYGAEINHHIMIEKVSISPLGGQIIIKELDNSDTFYEFVLRDNDNNYYSVLDTHSLIYKENKDNNDSKNSYEFIGANKNKDIKELSLIPIKNYDDVELKKISLENDILPKIEISNIGGYNIEDIVIDDIKVVVKFKPYGAILQSRSVINNAFGFLDKDGNDIRYLCNCSQEYEKENDLTILTYYWTEDAPENKKELIKGMRHIKVSNMELNESEAIVIKLK